MCTSQKHDCSCGFQRLYDQPVQEIEPYCLSPSQNLNPDVLPNSGGQETDLSFKRFNEEFFALDSFPATASFVICDSPSALSVTSNWSSFSPQPSHSYLSDQHHSSDGSSFSGSSAVNCENEVNNKLKELEHILMGSDLDTINSCNCYFNEGGNRVSSLPWYNQMVQMIPKLDLKKVLVACAKAVLDGDMPTSASLMHVLDQMVSVSGAPIQRLGAYMLEGLRARLESSGSLIYRKLKCKEPTSQELLSYMHILFQICPYWKFAYRSANVVIKEAMENESRIHIIDFQIAQGSQYMALIKDLATRPGGPPSVRITGIDDSQSTLARGGGLYMVGKRLSQLAAEHNVPFQFHDAAMSGCEIGLENLGFRPGEAIAVNFPYVLHHMPDESVSTENHRDRLLRLVKSLSPKVIILVEQESNTNTAAFLPRFIETMDYYLAMFESIDAACPRDDKKRINAEQHCVARDIVNMVACEGVERVERHELLGKWRLRFKMAGFVPIPLGSSVTLAIRDLLKEFSINYRLNEGDGALYLGWMNRALSTCSAWR